MSDQTQKDVIAAADFFNKTVRQLLTVNNAVHAETLVLAMARMSGALMFRTFGFDKGINPGTAVLSDKANAEGPVLMDMMLMTLRQLGHQITEADLNAEHATDKFSRLSFQQTEEKLAPFFLKYCEVAPIGLRTAAIAAGVATGMLVHDCAAALPVRDGAALAVYGFVEGTKTAPFTSMKTGGTRQARPQAAKKPWFKFWQ